MNNMPDDTLWEHIIKAAVAVDKTKTTALSVCALPGGLIRFSGKQADKLLQGQLTCDLKQLTPTQSLWGACCNPQGRVICFLWLFIFEDNYYAYVPLDSIELLLNHLDKFAKLSRVSIENVTSSWIGMGLINYADNKSVLPDFPSPSPAPLACTTPENFCLIQHKINSLSLLFCPETYVASVLASLPAYHLASSQEWQLREIQQRIPTVHHALSGQYTPADLNLVELGAVSFTKGCYCGQEIVARMHHLGKAKRSVYQIRCAAMLPPGTAVINSAGTEVGKILQAVSTPQEIQGLAVLQDSAVNSPEPRFTTTTGVSVQPSLPLV
jgi:folate-binding protein YgfZ